MTFSDAPVALNPALAPPARASGRRLWLARLARLLQLAPFALTGALYELLRNVFRAHGPVHVGDLAALEQRFFSVATSQGQRPLSEVIARHGHTWLDLCCGLTYLLFLAEIVAVSSYLLARTESGALQLSLNFLAVNLLGWLIWMLYPAAPPWYLDAYGPASTVHEVVSSPAGLLRFDALLGVPLAESFYAKSADVFGAMPSLHVAYATLVVCAVAPRAGWLRLGAIGFALSMAFSAVYLRHHYILDVVAGALLAVLVASASRLLRRFRGAWRARSAGERA